MMSHFFSMPSASPKTMEPAHLCLGQAYEMEGRKADALSEYRIGLKLNPYRVKTYSNLAHLLATPVKPTKRSPNFERLCVVSRRRAVTRLLAICSPTPRHTNEALAEFREAVRINPKDAALHDNLGAMLVELGRFDEAREHMPQPRDWTPQTGGHPI